MKRVVIPARHRSRNQAGMFSRRDGGLWSEGTINLPNERSPMEAQIRTLTPLELLGPLNDVERKYAPSTLFSAGPMEIPLPRPRVARSEEHTSELQSRVDLVCRLLLEKK